MVVFVYLKFTVFYNERGKICLNFNKLYAFVTRRVYLVTIACAPGGGRWLTT